MLPILLLPAWQAGASGGSVSEVPSVVTLYQSTTCQGLAGQPSVELLTAEQWQDLLRKQPPSAAKIPEPVGPLILVNMGERFTGGYALSLGSETPRIVYGDLNLPVVWSVPAPGMMQIQMISHPCLVVSVAADFQNVLVVDQDGKIQLSTKTQ